MLLQSLTTHTTLQQQHNLSISPIENPSSPLRISTIQSPRSNHPRINFPGFHNNTKRQVMRWIQLKLWSINQVYNHKSWERWYDDENPRNLIEKRRRWSNIERDRSQVFGFTLFLFLLRYAALSFCFLFSQFTWKALGFYLSHLRKKWPLKICFSKNRQGSDSSSASYMQGSAPPLKQFYFISKTILSYC